MGRLQSLNGGSFVSFGCTQVFIGSILSLSQWKYLPILVISISLIKSNCCKFLLWHFIPYGIDFTPNQLIFFIYHITFCLILHYFFLDFLQFMLRILPPLLMKLISYLNLLITLPYHIKMLLLRVNKRMFLFVFIIDSIFSHLFHLTLASIRTSLLTSHAS